MIYAIARKIVKAVLLIFNNWKVVGEENIPSSAAVVLVANHVSYWDPPVLGCAIRRKVHFMAKEEVYRVPFLKLLLPYLKCFPVKRGKADRAALRTAFKHLENGEIVGIFPEGTRNKGDGLLPFEQGAALIAIKGGATIIPVGLIGTKKAFPASLRGDIEIRIGKPLRYPELEGVKLTNDDLARVNMEIIEMIKLLIKK